MITLANGQVITGATVSGLTTPTYTLSLDQAPDTFSKQFIVSALGGTQTNVTAHSASSPFTVTAKRPKKLQSLRAANPATGLLPSGSVPKNTYSLIIRKGAAPLVNNAPEVNICRIEFSIAAGCEAYQSEQIRALASIAGGILSNQISGLSDTTIQGTI